VLPTDSGEVRQVRRELDDVLQRCGVAGAERADVALVISEAVTNVVQHAYRDGSPGPLYVAAAPAGHTLTVSVIDDGCGMPVPAGPAAGLGLTLIARLADALEIVSDASEPGTAVHVTFENITRLRKIRPDSSENGALFAHGALLRDDVRVHEDSEAVLTETQQALARGRRRRLPLRAP